MEKSLNYQALYTLQDQILSHVMALENDFYLTGGTALHLPWLEKINIITPLPITADSIHALCDDILYEQDNSLFSERLAND